MNTIAIGTMLRADWFRFVIRTTTTRIGMKIAPRRIARRQDGGFGSRTMRDFDELDLELLEPDVARAGDFEALLGSASSGSTSFPSPSR